MSNNLIIKRAIVKSSGDKSKSIPSNVAYIRFNRPLLFNDEMDLEETRIVLQNCFDDIFLPGTIVEFIDKEDMVTEGNQLKF